MGSVHEECGVFGLYARKNLPAADLVMGGLITEAIIAYCENMKNLNLPVSGPADGSLREIRVVF